MKEQRSFKLTGLILLPALALAALIVIGIVIERETFTRWEVFAIAIFVASLKILIGVGFALNGIERRRREARAKEAAEEALRRGEVRYRSLVEATTAVVWNTPASGEFETEQPGWSAFTGQSFDELKGWGWLNAVHPDDRPETSRVWSAAVASRSWSDNTMLFATLLMRTGLVGKIGAAGNRRP